MKKYFLWFIISLLVGLVLAEFKNKKTEEILLDGASGICEIIKVQYVPTKGYNSIELCLLYSNTRMKSYLSRRHSFLILEGDVGKYLEVKFLEDEPKDLVAVKILDTLPKDLSKYKGLPCSIQKKQ